MRFADNHKFRAIGRRICKSGLGARFLVDLFIPVTIRLDPNVDIPRRGEFSMKEKIFVDHMYALANGSAGVSVPDALQYLAGDTPLAGRYVRASDGGFQIPT